MCSKIFAFWEFLCYVLGVLFIQLAAGFAVLTFLGLVLALFGRLNSLAVQIVRIKNKIEAAKKEEAKIAQTVQQADPTTINKNKEKK